MLSSQPIKRPLQDILDKLEQNKISNVSVSVEELDHYKYLINKHIETIVIPLFGDSEGSFDTTLLLRSASPIENIQSLREKEDFYSQIKKDISNEEEEIASLSRLISINSEDIFRTDLLLRDSEKTVEFILNECARLSGIISSIRTVNLEPIVLEDSSSLDENKSSSKPENEAVVLHVKHKNRSKEDQIIYSLSSYIVLLQNYTSEAEVSIQKRDRYFKDGQTLTNKQTELIAEYKRKIEKLNKLTSDQLRLYKLINFSHIEMDTINLSKTPNTPITPDIIRMETVNVGVSSNDETDIIDSETVELIGLGQLDSSAVDEPDIVLDTNIRSNCLSNLYRKCSIENSETLSVIIKSSILFGSGAASGVLLLYLTPQSMFFLDSPVATYLLESALSTLTLFIAKKGISCLLEKCYRKNDSITLFNRNPPSPTTLGRYLDKESSDEERISHGINAKPPRV